MCDIQSSVIHSSTAPPLHQQDLTPTSLWDLAASSELAWGGMPNYQVIVQLGQLVQFVQFYSHSAKLATQIDHGCNIKQIISMPQN